MKGVILEPKQDKLTFDTTPTDYSKNPVTSGGVALALGQKQNKLTFDTFPRDGSSNPVTSDGVENAVVNVTPVIYNAVLTGVTVSSDNGYSAAIPYYTISRDISYDKIIGCILTGWSATAVLAPQLYSDGLYIYSSKAFSNGNVHLRLVCLPNVE